MSQLVRKQIYIKKRQNTLLKRQAKQRGISEAEFIREALDKQLSQAITRPAKPDPEAWERALAFMKALHAQGPLPDRPRDWKREDLYEERLTRNGAHSD